MDWFLYDSDLLMKESKKTWDLSEGPKPVISNQSSEIYFVTEDKPKFWIESQIILQPNFSQINPYLVSVLILNPLKTPEKL